MYTGKLTFSQVIDHLPMYDFRYCVDRYRGNHKVKTFTCRDQYLPMAFAQLTYRESLRDIEACLHSQSAKLYHMGIRGGISCTTLAKANEQRNWRIYTDFAQSLIRIARPLYTDENLSLDLDNTILRTRFHDHRPVPVHLPMGAFPQHQSRRQAAHPFGFARQHSDVHPYFRCDQTVTLTEVNTPDYYPTPLHRIKYYDAKTGKTFSFLTNNFIIPALMVADLYRYR